MQRRTGRPQPEWRASCAGWPAGRSPTREATLDPPVAGLDTRELRALDELRSAIEERLIVSVRYRGTDGRIVTRTLSPYAVLNRFGALSCVAYCDETGLTSIFILARL